MTTIILTIIGILLAAAAALMVIFYGGDAFNSGSTGAAANTVQNAGTNVVSAVQMVRAETGAAPAVTGANDAARFTSFVALTGTGGSYLKEAPSLPTGYASGMATTGQYIVTGVPADVCTRINANLKLTGVTSATAGTSSKMVCVPNATAGSPGTFYANS